MKKIRFISLLPAVLTIAGLLCASLVSCTGDKPEQTAEATDSSAVSAEVTEGGNVTSVSEAAKAEYFEIKTENFDGVDYTYLSGVTEEGKKQTVLEVPYVIDGKAICGISAGAFENCTLLESVTVHSNVEEWGGNIFKGCTALKTIKMDYAKYVKEAKEDPSKAEYFTAASAYDGTETGDNSIVCGLDKNKVRFVFPDQATYDFFATDYTWAIYTNLFTIDK